MNQDDTIAAEFGDELLALDRGARGFTSAAATPGGDYQAVGDPDMLLLRFRRPEGERAYMMRVWRAQDMRAERARREAENDATRPERSAQSHEDALAAAMATTRGFRLPTERPPHVHDDTHPATAIGVLHHPDVRTPEERRRDDVGPGGRHEARMGEEVVGPFRADDGWKAPIMQRLAALLAEMRKLEAEIAAEARRLRE